jgi:hypothetical protein
VIENIIRRRIGFDGLLMSDDLDMKALNGDIPSLAAGVVAAGCDIALNCWARMEDMVGIANALPNISDASRARLDRAMAGAGASGRRAAAGRADRRARCPARGGGLMAEREEAFDLFEAPRAAGEVLTLSFESWEGPLDLLLDLARSQKVDLKQISILALVEQYLTYIERAEALKLELAADYLVMAAWLAYLKSALLLPGRCRKIQVARRTGAAACTCGSSGWARCAMRRAADGARPAGARCVRARRARRAAGRPQARLWQCDFRWSRPMGRSRRAPQPVRPHGLAPDGDDARFGAGAVSAMLGVGLTGWSCAISCRPMPIRAAVARRWRPASSRRWNWRGRAGGIAQEGIFGPMLPARDGRAMSGTRRTATREPDDLVRAVEAALFAADGADEREGRFPQSSGRGRRHDARWSAGGSITPGAASAGRARQALAFPDRARSGPPAAARARGAAPPVARGDRSAGDRRLS